MRPATRWPTWDPRSAARSASEDIPAWAIPSSGRRTVRIGDQSSGETAPSLVHLTEIP